MTAPDRAADGAAARRQAAAAEQPWWRRLGAKTWRIVVATVGSCMRHRVTGLAAEAAFFAILSVPPLIFALSGSIGYVSDQFTAAQIDDVRRAVLDLASRALTERAVDRIISPTINDVLEGGRFDVISVGFVLALWSGSRALHVFVDTITIMHGLGGHRGIIKTRALSFGLYVLAMLTGIVSIPLIVAGPSLVRDWLPDQLDFLMSFYWPAILVLSICFLATLYHVSVPVRTNWTFNLPGATFSLACWILGSYLLREFLTVTAADSRSIYGPLAAPIASCSGSTSWRSRCSSARRSTRPSTRSFPQQSTTRARLELVQRLLTGWRATTTKTPTSRRRTRDPRDSIRACPTTRLSGAQPGRPSLMGGTRIALPDRVRSPGGSWVAGCWRRWRSSSGPCCWSTSTATATGTATTRLSTASTSSTRSTTRP